MEQSLLKSLNKLFSLVLYNYYCTLFDDDDRSLGAVSSLNSAYFTSVSHTIPTWHVAAMTFSSSRIDVAERSGN